MNQSDAIRADHLPQGCANSLKQPSLLCGSVNRVSTRIIVNFPDEMREHLCVSVGAKLRVATTDELILKRLIVFNDAIVNERQLAACVKMGMRIFVVHAAVGCPARVANA